MNLFILRHASAGTRRAYGTYWNRITEHWGARHLDEPTPTEIKQLMAHVPPDLDTEQCLVRLQD